MKIGLVHTRLDLRGGTEQDLYRTAEGLRDRGHAVHLFCSEFSVQAPADVTAHRVPVLPLGRTARLWSFATRAPKVAAACGCDIVVGFGRILRQDVVRSGGGSHRGFLERLGREGGLRRRLWQHASLYHRSVLAIEKRQYRAQCFARVLAVSEAVKRDLMINYAIPEAKITVLYNGVDSQRFNPARRSAGAAVRQRWGVPAQADLVLFVGSGFRRKGLDRLLKLWDSSDLRDVWLLVVGDDARAALYKNWGARVGRGRIVFAGRQADVENYYVAADVLALPALQEAFGNVVLEALSSGLPVLVAREVGAAEVLSGALLEGIVEHPEQPGELKKKLLELLRRARDPEIKRAARSIGEQYSWQNHFSELEACLTRAQRADQLP